MLGPDASEQEWHAARAGRLGGSDMAAVLGRSPWVSPYRLWHLKAGRVTDGPTTAPQARGHYLEPGIRQWWADKNPEYEVADAGTFVHHERDYQLANPDGIVVQSGEPVGILEVKTDGQDDPDTWGTSGTDEIPLYYRTQIMWYLDALGLTVAHVAVLTRNLEFRHYTVRYDPDDAAILRYRAELFLDSLMFNEPPDFDGAKNTYETVRELHPAIDGTTVDLTFDEAAAYCSAKNTLKAAEEHEQHQRSILADRMGAAKKARYGEITIATRQARGDGSPFVVASRKLPDIRTRTEEEDTVT
ncbi:YqaJ viral recombinase family nuclease [Haloactinospora alba]|uniref:YqaJ viral recombinase family nuclease n=1 Tax=Haloactinospora alba TaxID=405555 RepID=UPI00147776BA|nr:YqaJ viral recombinase family protein [Haloactinospora alba]